MNQALTICKRDFRAYFHSMSGYVFIGFYLMLTGYFFSSFVLASRVADLRIFNPSMAFFFMFASPLLTMKIWAEEKKNGTDQLILTAPTTIASLVIGKFLGAFAVYLVMLLLTIHMPIIVIIYGDPEILPILTGYLGLVLLGGAFISLGSFVSSLTENQIIAGIITLCMLVLFYLLILVEHALPNALGAFLTNLSLLAHYFEFAAGLLDIGNIVYYLSFIFFWLFMTWINIERKRWS